jgi:hypothetical protein
MSRRKPYTEAGIARIPCFRCEKPSFFQWQVCSDNNVYRGICKSCDLKLNKLVLKFMKFPDWKEKFENYKKEVLSLR